LLSTGKARALRLMRLAISASPSPGLAAIISAAVPATRGTAKLVPMVMSLMPV
jgi:hypothetical protein